MLVWISGTPLELDAGLRARRGGTCSDRIISSRASFEKGYRMNLVPIGCIEHREQEQNTNTRVLSSLDGTLSGIVSLG